MRTAEGQPPAGIQPPDVMPEETSATTRPSQQTEKVEQSQTTQAVSCESSERNKRKLRTNGKSQENEDKFEPPETSQSMETNHTTPVVSSLRIAGENLPTRSVNLFQIWNCLLKSNHFSSFIVINKKLAMVATLRF
nr:hypothetical protein Iba_chr08aCG5580 [Ipomoea batatas]